MSFSAPTTPRAASILVVDDEASIRRMVCRVFKDSPHLVRAVKCPEEALSILGREDFDLIILDLSFPGGLQGIECLRALKADPRIEDVPIVVITGKVDDGHLVRCKELGAAICFRKPFAPQAFREAVERLLSETLEKQSQANGVARPLILQVEDEDDWAELVHLWLSNNGFAVRRTSNSREMHRLLDNIERLPDCILMDIKLTDADGLQVCDDLKADPRFQKIPIVILTGQENMQIPGLRHKALHVVKKSRNAVTELLAALESVLAQQEWTLGVLKAGDLRLDPRWPEPRVYRGESLLCTLDHSLYAILRCLIERSPSVVPDGVLRRVSMQRSNYHRRDGGDAPSKTVETYICALRRMLGKEVGRRIVRAHGVGYAYIFPPGKTRR